MGKQKAPIVTEIATDGYPLYPENEDIYNKSLQQKNINPEDILKLKSPNDDDNNKFSNSRNSSKYKSGTDLDIPGTELDDVDEDIGSEDEENNYYSLGGDRHNELDEENG